MKTWIEIQRDATENVRRQSLMAAESVNELLDNFTEEMREPFDYAVRRAFVKGYELGMKQGRRDEAQDAVKHMEVV